MNYYVINHCNQWHDYNSFRFIGIVDDKHLREAMETIQKKLKYTDEEMDAYIDVSGIDGINALDI